MATRRKVKKAKRKVKRKTKRATVMKRKVKRPAVKEGETVRDDSLSLYRSPTPTEVEELVRRGNKWQVFARKAACAAAGAREKARAELRADPRYRAMVRQQRAATPAAAACEPEDRREALAWLQAIAEHIRANFEDYRALAGHIWTNLEDYRAHGPLVPAGDDEGFYAAALMQRAQLLADIRHFRWFVDAVKVYGSEKNKKSLEQLLGLKPRLGRPKARKRGKNFNKARRMFILRPMKSATRKSRDGRGTLTPWKEVTADPEVGLSVKRAQRVYAQELPNVIADIAKKIAARRKQRDKTGVNEKKRLRHRAALDRAKKGVRQPPP